MKKTSFIATGDAFITRRFPEGGYEGFEAVRDCIMQHDVKFSNLEMTFHDHEGYPAAFSGSSVPSASRLYLRTRRSSSRCLASSLAVRSTAALSIGSGLTLTPSTHVVKWWRQLGWNSPARTATLSSG